MTSGTPLSGPLQPIPRGLAFCEKLEDEEGVEWESQQMRERLNEFLSRPVPDRHCRCGQTLKFFETGGGVCSRCREALELSDAQGNTGRPQTMASMNVPPSYQHCTYSTFRGDIDSSIDNWAVNPKGALLFLGDKPGVGKTHLATATLYTLKSGGKSCWWVSAPELAQNLSDEVFRDDKSTFRKSSNVEFLLIDDLGREFGVVPRAAELLQNLIDARFRHNKPTIVTSNMTEEKFEQYCPRTASRLLGGATIVHRQGEDERIKA